MITSRVREENAEEQQLLSRPHGHINMKMRSVHGQEIQRGEPNQGAGGHEVEVARVGKGKVPKDDQSRPQDWNKKL